LWPFRDGTDLVWGDGNASASNAESKEVNFWGFKDTLAWFQKKMVVMEGDKEILGNIVVQLVLFCPSHDDAIVYVVLELWPILGI
jgi:hypothetical protein